MDNENSWYAFYPEAAKNFEESAIPARHMAEVVRLAARDYGGRPAVSSQLPNGACATLDFNDVDRLTDDFACTCYSSMGPTVSAPAKPPFSAPAGPTTTN